MLIRRLENPILYSGKELRPHWIYETTYAQKAPMLGTAMVAFFGPCFVKNESLVDLVDFKEGEFIKAKWMLHFIGEIFEGSLKESVLLQRLWADHVRDYLSELGAPNIRRDGNDLYQVLPTKKKLSVSIVTRSVVSNLFHLGINWDDDGAPVETTSIPKLVGDIVVNPNAFADELLRRFQTEVEQVTQACVKVRPVL